MTIRPGSHETSPFLCRLVELSIELVSIDNSTRDSRNLYSPLCWGLVWLLLCIRIWRWRKMLIVGRLIATHWPTEKLIYHRQAIRLEQHKNTSKQWTTNQSWFTTMEQFIASQGSATRWVSYNPTVEIKTSIKEDPPPSTKSPDRSATDGEKTYVSLFENCLIIWWYGDIYDMMVF